MVHDICPGVTPWKDFPTQSDIVEKDSFVENGRDEPN
jgi:hypothetical protein